jgi:predicted molibdopterin-dependent oxidoreductase YjgC
MRAGEIFVPFVKLQEHAANYLTNAAFDPNSRIPEYKVCAVRIDKIGADAEGASGGKRRRKSPSTV